MKIKVTSGGDFQALESGSYVAICNSVIDLGVQPGRGQYPKPRPEILLNFELPTEMTEWEGEQRPRTVAHKFTASMHKKANLRKFIESFFGKSFPTDDAASDFDLKALLGRFCLLSVEKVERNGKHYTNVKGVATLPKGMKAEHKQHFENFYYSLDAPDHETFKKFPDWLQQLISGRILMDQSSPASPGNVADDFGDDDMPF